MNSPEAIRGTVAKKSSWTSVGLSLGCAGVFLVFLMMDQMSPFDRTRQGVLTGFLPRTVLFLVWTGEALAVIVGIGSFLLIRREDRDANAIVGIVARSLCGIAVGLFGTVVLWLVVGHMVIGF